MMIHITVAYSRNMLRAMNEKFTLQIDCSLIIYKTMKVYQRNVD